MRTHTCFVAPGIVVFLLGLAVTVQAASRTFYYEGEYALAIPAAAGVSRGWMNSAILAVPNHVTIADLDIMVTLTHTSVFDLQLFLESPSGRRMLLNAYDLVSGYSRGADYDHTVFDDEADAAIQEGLAPFTGHFRPRESLSLFDGQDACGSWQLLIYDAAYYDTGQLQRFGLSITTTVAAPVPSALTLGLVGLGLVRGLSRRRPGGGSGTPATGRGRTGGRSPGP